MDSEGSYIGCPCGLETLRAQHDSLNTRVVEQLNQTQELVMLNNFSRESNEYHFKKCLQERMSDIASWRWVLEDLARRLEEAIASLKYEHNALCVVGERVHNEIVEKSEAGSRPGALSPMTDTVEHAILQEYNFLRDQKKKFAKLVLEVEKQVTALQKTKKRIEADVIHKKQALSVEESCATVSAHSSNMEGAQRNKKRGSPVGRWENRCSFLKRAGLRALSDSIINRQQVRGARAYLSIAAQAHTTRVNSALRRRLHSNKIKLQDLQWQREEAIRDYNSLEEEMESTERNIIETMEQERLVEARRADRLLRPGRELTRDQVDRNLSDELGRMRCFSKQLRANHERITSLQNHLTGLVMRIDCHAEDLIQVISLDEERIKSRGEDGPQCNSGTSAPVCCTSQTQMSSGSPRGITTQMSSDSPRGIATQMSSDSPRGITTDVLTVIIEEDEEDDYPFEH